MIASWVRFSRMLLAASLLPVAAAWAQNAEPGSAPSLLIAPFVPGHDFCADAVADPSIVTDDQAAALCASHRQSPGDRLAAALDAIGPKISPSGKYQLGYTLNLPLFGLFRKQGQEWVVDTEKLQWALGNISAVDRPVVVFLSSDHFNVGGLEFAQELAQDPRNLMWSRGGPMVAGQYFDFATIAWTLTDQDAPVTKYRLQIFNAAIDAICALPPAAQARIAAVSVLGETHDLFPGLVVGPGFNIAPSDGTDYSPAAVAGFRSWLAQKYERISDLNREIGGAFSSFDAIEAPSKDIRHESLNNFFDHIDPFAAGNVPVVGWVHDKLGRRLRVTVLLDGRTLGVAQGGLSRTDVTDAVPSIADPNLGFRYDLDYRNVADGIHRLEVMVAVEDHPPLLLARRDLVIVDRAQDPVQPIPSVETAAPPLATDPNHSGYLDGPVPLQSLFYNPLAALWLEYRNHVVRSYIEQFARIAAKSCIPVDKVFSHQITPSLYGSWNGDLLAADASKRPDPFYNQGTTLYGGAAFGQAFLDLKNQLSWQRYAVNEMHPLTRLSREEFSGMFELHRLNGAKFVAPYFISILPSRVPLSAEFSRFSIAAGNPRYGSDLYWQAILDVMKH